MKNKLGFKNWIIIIVLGTLGQIAWNIENSWFSTFMYDEVSHASEPIAIMVGASAVVATLTAIFAGTISDRIGKRKIFITVGYILWGISTILYPFSGAARSVNLAVALVVAMDCVMTFFGATAYDSAFNAWTTDITTEHNRGSVVSVLQICPLIASILMSGSGAIIDNQGYMTFFIGVGVLVSVLGLVFGLLVKESSDLKPVVKGSFKEQLLGVFSMKTITSNKKLFYVLLSFMFIMAAYQVCGAYDAIYMKNYLNIEYTVISLINVSALPASIIGSVVAGIMSNKNKSFEAMMLSVTCFALGSVMISFCKGMVPLIVAKVLQMAGMMSMVVAATVEFKNLLPENQNAQFEGVRMIFVNMIPMVVGPAIGSVLINAFGIKTVIDGADAVVPTPIIYIACAIVACLAYVSLYLIKKNEGKADV